MVTIDTGSSPSINTGLIPDSGVSELGTPKTTKTGSPTLSIETGHALGSHGLGATGSGPEIPPPKLGAGANTQSQLSEVSAQTFNLADVYASLLRLANDENENANKEAFAQIEGAQAQAEFSMDQASEMVSSAWSGFAGAMVMAGVSVAMAGVSMYGAGQAGAAAEEAAGSTKFTAPETETLEETTEMTTRTSTRGTMVEDMPEEEETTPTSSRTGVSDDMPLEETEDPQSEQVQKNKAKLEDEKLNEMGFNEKDRSEMYEKAYARVSGKYQSWTTIGNAMGTMSNAAASVGAAGHQAQGTKDQAYAQLAGTTQQSDANVAQQMNSFMSEIRSMVNSTMSSEFQLASKV